LLHFHFLRSKQNPGFIVESPIKNQKFRIAPSGISPITK
jgi:hypothetical protein